MLACGNLAVLVNDLLKQRRDVVAADTNDSGYLVRYRSVLGAGGHRLDACLDGVLRRDVADKVAMLVSPLVVLFHPLDPLRVGVVVVLQTNSRALASAEFLVRTQGSVHTAHELRKTEGIAATPLPRGLFLPSLISRHGICFWRRTNRRASDKWRQFVRAEKSWRVMEQKSWY